MLKNDYLLAKIGFDTAENETVRVAREAAGFDPAADRVAHAEETLPGADHRRDTSLFPRLVLGCIGADLCK